MRLVLLMAASETVKPFERLEHRILDGSLPRRAPIRHSAVPNVAAASHTDSAFRAASSPCLALLAGRTNVARRWDPVESLSDSVDRVMAGGKWLR